MAKDSATNVLLKVAPYICLPFREPTNEPEAVVKVSGVAFGGRRSTWKSCFRSMFPDPVALEFTIYRVAPERPLPRSVNTINRELQHKRLPTLRWFSV
jgi:hypothetical protein